MMKLRKLLFTSLALALSVSPVFAEAYTGSDNWTVSFDGNSMNSSFKNSEISDEISKLMQPGDSVSFEVALSNDYSEDTDWYMSNEVLSSLENSVENAHGGAYSYVLTYTDSNGTTSLLYSNDSDTIGGYGVSENTEYAYTITKDSAKLEGLKQATTSLSDWFYLDTVGSKKGGKVNLKVSLEGESLPDSYQDTMAKLQLKFAVELTKSTSKKIHKSVDTSDTSNILMYSVVALVAGLACVGLVIYNVKSRKEEE